MCSILYIWNKYCWKCIPAHVASSGTRIKCRRIVFGLNKTFVYAKSGRTAVFGSVCGCTTVIGIWNTGPFATSVTSYARTL